MAHYEKVAFIISTTGALPQYCLNAVGIKRSINGFTV